jgi:endonuclease-3 related protein
MPNLFLDVYSLLYDHFGPRNWWPAETPFEVMVGAVLTQNTNWSNVQKAIDRLRSENLLSYESLSQLRAEEIAPLITSSGYYNLKAARLRNLLNMVEDKYDGEFELLLNDSLWSARENLLEVKGVGPETADSILLYACNLPIFVVDAYTHRVFSRHNLVDEESDYDSIQDIFTGNLPEDVRLYNEYHALIVAVAATYCKKSKPLCKECPLQGVNC